MYQKLSNVAGASAASEHYVKSNLIPALDMVDKAGGSRRTALDYVYAHNLKEALTLNPNYKLPRGTTIQDVNNTIQMFQNKPEYEAFRQSMQDYWGNLRQELVDSGWLSQAQKDQMEQLYPNYMPKFRKQDLENPDKFEEAFSRLIGARGTKNPVHKLENGSEDLLGDPIENIVKATQNMQYAAMRNKALQHLDDIKGLQLKNGTTPVKEVTDVSKASNPVKVRFDGKERIYDVHKELAEAITSVKDVLELDPVLNMVAKAAKTQRGLVTGNLTFVIRDLPRNLQHAWVTSKAGMSLIRDVPQAALDIMTGGKRTGSMLEDFLKNGGGNSTVWSHDRSMFEELQKKPIKRNTKKASKI
jgi:hypothetical protein